MGSVAYNPPRRQYISSISVVYTANWVIKKSPIPPIFKEPSKQLWKFDDDNHPYNQTRSGPAAAPGDASTSLAGSEFPRSP